MASQMENRVELSTLEYKEVWDRIYNDFNFEPSISNFPSFDVPKPFITYDVSSYINWSGDIDTYNEHPGYWINPHLEFQKVSLMDGQHPSFQTVLITFLFIKF